MTDVDIARAAKAQHRHAFRVADWPMAGLRWAVLIAWHLARITICAVLVLGEPVMRAVLVPVAFLGFLVTMIFGFLIGDPRFPRLGMLGFSAGALVLYWFYLWVMSLFMSLPSHDYER